MGEGEKRVQRKVRRKNIQRAVLSAIQVSGMLTVAVLAPNVLQILRYTKGSKSSHTQRIHKSIKRMEKKGLIKKNSEGRLFLTNYGQVTIQKIEMGNSDLAKPRKWDKHWRMVIFDIPERKRKSRDQLRLMLKSIGFYRLQGSVWVYPYDCEDLVTLIKTDFLLGKEVLYLVTEYLESDTAIKKHFKLT